MVYHIVIPYNLNDIHKHPPDSVHNHNKHYRMDWVDELNDFFFQPVCAESFFTFTTIISIIGWWTNTTSTISFWDTLSIICTWIHCTNIVLKRKKRMNIVWGKISIYNLDNDFLHVPLDKYIEQHLDHSCKYRHHNHSVSMGQLWLKKKRRIHIMINIYQSRTLFLIR